MAVGRGLSASLACAWTANFFHLVKLVRLTIQGFFSRLNCSVTEHSADTLVVSLNFKGLFDFFQVEDRFTLGLELGYGLES